MCLCVCRAGRTEVTKRPFAARLPEGWYWKIWLRKLHGTHALAQYATICQCQKHRERCSLNLIIIIICHSQWPHDPMASNCTFPSAPILSQSPGHQQLGDTGRGGKSLLPPVFRHLHCKYNCPNPPVQPAEADGCLQGCWTHLPLWTTRGIWWCEAPSLLSPGAGVPALAEESVLVPCWATADLLLAGKGKRGAFAMQLCHALVFWERSKSVWGISVSALWWDNRNSTALSRLFPVSPHLPPFT